MRNPVPYRAMVYLSLSHLYGDCSFTPFSIDISYADIGPWSQALS